MRRTFFRAFVFRISAATMIAAVVAMTSSTAQTPQLAYTSVVASQDTAACCSSCCACNAFCPYYNFSSYIVTPYGGTPGPNDTQPTWSADGTKIAFTRNGDIFVADASGSNAIDITNTANNSAPAWSPNGSRIAFASTRNNPSGDLFLVNPDGSNVVRLTYNVASSVGHPAWSQDGTRIAFNCQVQAGNDDICTINLDGTGFARLTSDPASDSFPTWSPDGLSIAFSTTRYGTDPVIDVMNTDGSDVRQVGAAITGSEPAWSPDGAQIAFDVLDPNWSGYGYDIPDIYLMQADGTNVTSFQTSGGDPAWMPMRVPIATFKVSCTGTTCNFDASGSKDSYTTITGYAWNFGDGTTAAGAILAHTYAAIGNYTVKLTVTDANGATGTKFQALTVNPVAAFTFSCSGLACNFNASGSTDSSATITSYTWKFGDGASGAGITISHTYAVGNSYKVTLTVTDSIGATGTQSQTVIANAPPVASFVFVCNGLTCSFDGSGSRDPDGTITSYSWNFGNGVTASGPSVSDTYAAGGQYTVTLIVADNGGATNAESQTVIVNAPPVASFTFSCSAFTCTFYGSGSFDSDGTIASYAWQFGDSTAGTGVTVKHTYRAPGTYTVTLTVTDNGGAIGVQSNNLTLVRRK